MLDIWSESVLNQIRTTTDSPKHWDPVPAAVELLAIGVRMMGLPESSKPTFAESIDALFVDVDGYDISNRSPSWQLLIREFRTHLSSLREIIISRMPCTKGGYPHVMFLDSAQLFNPIRNVQKKWQLTEAIPGNIRDDLKSVGILGAKVRELLDGAISEEKDRIANWREDTISHMGMGNKPNQQELLKQLRNIIESTENIGAFPGTAIRESLDEAISVFESVDFQECLSNADRISKEKNKGELLRFLGHDNELAISASKKLLQQIEVFRSGANSRLQTDIANHHEIAELKSATLEIGKEFDEIMAIVNGLREED